MAATRVEFTSYVDKEGYKVLPAKWRTVPRPGQSVADRILDSRPGDHIQARIVGLGGGLRAVRLNDYPRLFSKFASIRTEGELLKFVAEYGPLTPAGKAGGKGDQIPQLLDAAASMNECLNQRGRSHLAWSIADLKARLLHDKAKGTLSIKISPARLIDALWLQLGQALVGGAHWRNCEHCGELFAVGGESGRRLVARFCSDKCRINFNSLRRSR
jgi:hypothetical protein